MPKRINPILQYFMYLAGTLAAYGVYAFIVVPKIETAPSVAEKKVTPRVAQSRTDRKEKFAHLFPPTAWELGSCKVLETSQGTVLFKDYQPFNDGRVEVYPFTMIIRGDSLKKTKDTSTDVAPIVLRSSKKAVLKFERAFQFEGGDAGKIQHGQLSGQVSIYRPPSSEGADDYLKVLTANVQLEKHKIFTADDVEFEFGPNHGHGRHLSIELSHDTPLGAINADFSKINGIRNLKLGHLQRMRILPVKKNSGKRFLSGQEAPIEVRCAGPFNFNFEKQRATFLDQVSVRQLDDTGQSLSCNELNLFFDTKIEGTAQPLYPDPQSEPMSKDLELRRIVAKGSPVSLVAQSRKADIRAEYLDYDLATNKLIAKGSEGVTFQLDGQHFAGTQVEYRIREDGSMGPLIADGPGSLHRKDENSSFSAEWTDSLTVAPATTGQKLVTLNGNSRLTLDGETSVSGSGMQILLWEVAQPTAMDDSDPTSKKPKWKYLPHELRSIGDVSIDSPELSGNTQSMLLRWPAPNLATPKQNLQIPSVHRVNKFSPRPQPVPRQDGQYQPPTSNRTQDNFQPQTSLVPIRRRNSSGQSNPVGRIATQQNLMETPRARTNFPVQQASFLSQAAERSAPQTKTEFVGNSVEVDFAGHDRDSGIKQLVIKGQVEARQYSLKNPEKEPLQIKGEELFLLPQSKELFRLNVAGNASVVAKGMNLTGPDIHLDQSANRLWVVGAGTMDVVQIPKLKPGEVRLPGEEPVPQEISMMWNGGMVFDGRTIYFEDEVAASGLKTDKNGKRSKIRSLSQGLSVVLSRPVDFRKVKDEQDGNENDFGNIEVAEMILVDHLPDEKRVFQTPNPTEASPGHEPVIFEKQDFDDQGEIIAKQKMIVPHASIDITTGNMRASGPGTLMNWKKGGANMDSPFRVASAQLRQQSNPNQKSFVRINFEKSLQADSDHGNLQIDGRIRALYSEVDNFDQQFNPDNPTRPSGAIKLTCEQMEMAQWQPRGSNEKSSEMTARGSSRIVGDQFEAIADRLSFSEVADQLVLEGSPRTNAHLTYVDPVTGSERKLVAGKILYRPNEGSTEIQKVQTATMNQDGSLFDRQNRN